MNCKSIMGEFIKGLVITFFLAVFMPVFSLAQGGELFPPKGFTFAESRLPIGMNLNEVTYYSSTRVFTDVMKTAGSSSGYWKGLMTYPIAAPDWKGGDITQMATDTNGWPLELPQNVDGQPHGIMFLINNTAYAGDYAVLYDGTGTITWSGCPKHIDSDGNMVLTLTGTGSNVYCKISASSKGNYVHNMRIVPVGYVGRETAMPTFAPLFIKGLQPFHAIRSMKFTGTKNSPIQEWKDRATPSFFSQATARGVSWEHVVELSNMLQADAWVCVPHQATDDYITKMAEFLLANLDPARTLYIEYSNELWNWALVQSSYVLNNAPGHSNSYVSSELLSIGAPGKNHAEKMAYMAGRTFKIFNQIWSARRSKLIDTLGVQQAYLDNTRRSLEYLFNVDGVGCDAVSPGGYFNYNLDDHAIWNAMPPADVTPTMIINSADKQMEKDRFVWIDGVAQLAQKYNIDYIVYEGGQHMQPYQQKVWGYNHAVYDAQIDPRMYDLYMKNLDKHISVGCKLFMAFSYVGLRVNRYGSFGHLEKLEQLNEPDMRIISPKYQALIDKNTVK